MAGPSWLVDKYRIATKIRSASGDPAKINWKSNPSRSCPNCQYFIDNSDVAQAWPGLPQGVKFDPSDPEIIRHLCAKVGFENLEPHPFIDEFILTVGEDDGICYTHPQNLPGVKQDGSVSHFFHKAIKAYGRGKRKRRKIHAGNFGDVSWRRTGLTKPVLLDGVQKGCKKIMVLYVSQVTGGKIEKTNCVMHQCHLGTEEDEREGEYVISKVFYQQQQGKQIERIEDIPEGIDSVILKVDPVTLKSVTPEPPHAGRRSSWLVDKNRIATKIRCASGDPAKINWKSNPTRSCPNCQYFIDNSDVAQAWPGLPQGVKFDPSDPEIIWHLCAKVGVENLEPHPFIDEFIPTVDEADGICYTHPQNLPGVKQDGSVAHLFHKPIKAYSTGTKKRRKTFGDNSVDVSWHKTGRTDPVLLDGVQKGCKKIMVLHLRRATGRKAEKTNWVMHQYHLGMEEDERESEYVISKVFYKQQQGEQMRSEDIPEVIGSAIPKVDPVTPKLVTPKAPRFERRFSNYDTEQDFAPPIVERHNESLMRYELETPSEHSCDQNPDIAENLADQAGDKNEDEAAEDSKFPEIVSQELLSSQEAFERIDICDEFLQSQSPNRDESGNGRGPTRKSLLSEYAHLGPDDFKRDLEECQNYVLDLANIDTDTPPDGRLSQLGFPSQDSYFSCGGASEEAS